MGCCWAQQLARLLIRWSQVRILHLEILVMEEARLKYPHSKFWLIFWLILFFPIGLVLLSQLELVSPTGIKKWEYRGIRFWLYFWAILFFPIAFLLLLLNGVLVKTPRI